VALIGPLVMPGRNVPEQLLRARWRGLPMSTVQTIGDRQSFLSLWQPAIDKYAADARLAAFVQPHLWQCQPECLFVRDGQSLFADPSHLTAPVAAELTPLLSGLLASGP